MLDWFTVTGTPTRPAAFYLALYTTNPTDFDAGTGGTEATGGGYVRKSMAMDAATSADPSVTENTGAIAWTVGTDLAAATYKGWGIYTADSSGTYLAGKAFAADRVVASAGDKVNIAAGAIILNLANAA
jgi:hypothetical protein